MIARLKETTEEAYSTPLTFGTAEHHNRSLGICLSNDRRQGPVVITPWPGTKTWVGRPATGLVS
jgi:hypothetical protein